MDVGGMGARPELRMEIEMALIASNGTESRAAIRRSVNLPGVSPFGRAAAVFEPDRRQLAARLTDGVEAEMDALLDIETCKPVVANLAVSGGKVVAEVGRNQGLTRGSIAFTADADFSTEMLEVVEIGREPGGVAPAGSGAACAGLCRASGAVCGDGAMRVVVLVALMLASPVAAMEYAAGVPGAEVGRLVRAAMAAAGEDVPDFCRSGAGLSALRRGARRGTTAGKLVHRRGGLCGPGLEPCGADGGCGACDGGA